MKGKWVSSRVYLGSTELFYIPEVQEVFLSSCEMKDENEFKPLQGNRASSSAEGDVSWDFSSCSRNLGYILELPWEWPFETQLCSVKSGLLSSSDGHLRSLN